MHEKIETEGAPQPGPTGFFKRWRDLSRRASPQAAWPNSFLIAPLCLTLFWLDQIDAAVWNVYGVYAFFLGQWLPAVPTWVLLAWVPLVAVAQMLLFAMAADVWRVRIGGLRWLAASAVPIAGVWLVPISQWWSARNRPAAAEAPLDSRMAQAISRAGRGPFGANSHLLAGGLHSIGLALFAAWLGHPEARSATARLALILFSVVLHLLATAVVGLAAWQSAGRLAGLSRVARLALSLLWLPPLPWLAWLAGYVLPTVVPAIFSSDALAAHPAAVGRSSQRHPDVLAQADENRRSRLRVPSLLRPWAMPTYLPAMLTQQKIRTLIRLQGFGLLLDGAWLSWLFWAGAEDRSRPLLRLGSGCTCAGLAIAACFASIAAVARIVVFLRRLRSPTQPHRLLDEVPSAVFRTQAALFIGLALGAHLTRHPNAHGLDALMALGVAMAYTMERLNRADRSYLPAAWRRRPDGEPKWKTYLDGVLLTSLLAAILSYGWNGALTRLWILVLPWRLVIIGQSYLPWLLRPLTLRQALQRPGRERLGWAALALAAVVPFGGWFLPLILPLRETLLQRIAPGPGQSPASVPSPR